MFWLSALRVGCVEVDLAEGGDLAGWQMVEDDAARDRRSRFVGTPVVDREDMPSTGTGGGEGGGTGGDTELGFCQNWTFVLFLLCLYFLGASEAFSLAERASGLLQYSSALWWWVSTWANSCLTCCLSWLKSCFLTPFLVEVFFWLGGNLLLNQGRDRDPSQSRRIKEMGNFFNDSSYKTRQALWRWMSLRATVHIFLPDFFLM